MATPLVSVIVTAYRQPHYLNQALESIEQQTWRNYETIVVDDGSGEDTVALYRLPGRARLIVHPHRSGRAAVTRNSGVRAAKGEYVAFLDQDDIWLPEKIERQVGLLEARPHVALAYCHCTAVDAELRPVRRQPKVVCDAPDVSRALIRRRFIKTPSVVCVRRCAIEEVGLFDETISGASDWDFWMRLARSHAFAAMPDRLVLYRTHPEQLHRVGHEVIPGKVRALEKALRWAEAERPDLVREIRYRLARMLRRLGRMNLRRGDDLSAACEALSRSVALWPWDPRTHWLYLAARWKRTRKERDEKRPCSRS